MTEAQKKLEAYVEALDYYNAAVETHRIAGEAVDCTRMRYQEAWRQFKIEDWKPGMHQLLDGRVILIGAYGDYPDPYTVVSRHS